MTKQDEFIYVNGGNPLSVDLSYYREGAVDKEVFDDYVETLVEVVNECGPLHLKSALCVESMRIYSGCPSGFFEDVLMPCSGPEKDPLEGYYTEDYFHKNKKDITGLVECFGTFDKMYYRRIYQTEKHLLNFMFDRGWVSSEEVKRVCSEKGWVTRWFDGYCVGKYIKFGWVILLSSDDYDYYYKLTPVGWDGINIPEGCLDYDQWRTIKER